MTSTFNKAAIFLIALIAADFTQAEVSVNKLAGEYFVGGKTLIDPPHGEPSDTHLYLTITGEAAKEVYFMIEAETQLDLCLDDGTLTKFADNIQCQFNPNNKEHVCFLAIDINSNTISSGGEC